MNFRRILILVIIIFFNGCVEYIPSNSKKVNFKTEKKYKNNGFSLIFGSSLQGLFQGTGRRDGTLWKVLDELLDANPASLVILGHTVSEQIDLPPDPFPYRLVRRLSASDDFFGDMKTRNGETSDYEICVFQLKATNQERLKSSPFTSKRYFLDEL